MIKVNMHEAKSNFSKLVELALQGEEVIVARNGKPLVKLVPLEDSAGLRPTGLHRRKLSEEEAAEAMHPLSEEELKHWYESPFPEP
jgi:prevent-host-death family protein